MARPETIAGKTKTIRHAEIHFCGRCGSTTHFTLTDSAISKFGNVQTGINMALADENASRRTRTSLPLDGRGLGRAVTDFGYVREPQIIGQ